MTATAAPFAPDGSTARDDAGGRVPPLPAARALVERLGRARALDGVVGGLRAVVSRARPAAAREALSGEWLGHALHPLLTDVVIGCWMSAAVVDVAGGRGSRSAADRLIGLGTVSALPTVAAGWSDWLDAGARDPELARIGIVHAIANAAGLGLHVASLRARGRGDRGRGKALSLGGLALVGAGGYLGAHLSYVHGARVERATGA